MFKQIANKMACGKDDLRWYLNYTYGDSIQGKYGICIASNSPTNPAVADGYLNSIHAERCNEGNMYLQCLVTSVLNYLIRALQEVEKEQNIYVKGALHAD